MKTTRLFLTFVAVLFLLLIATLVKGQNTLSINNVSALPSSLVTVEVVMNNANPVVAFQMDIPLPTGITYQTGTATLLRGSTNHPPMQASIIGTNTLRLLSHSSPVTPYTGTSGDVLCTFQLNTSSTENIYPLNITNAVLSDANGNQIFTSATSGNVTVAKGTPTVSPWPSTTAITYGAQVSTATLSGGAATYNSVNVPGVFAYTNPSVVPNAGTYTAAVRFTPTDGVRYNTVDGTVDVTVNARAITVTADAKSKTYGDGDPSFTYSLTSGTLVGSDALGGTASRDAGETVGTYAINKGGVAVSPTPGNYVITWVSANLTINKRNVTATAAAKSKTYGDSDPALTYTGSALAFSDTWGGALTRVSGEDVGDYQIQQGTVAPSNPGNYNVSYTPANLTINKRAITVTPTPGQSKNYGAANPGAYTYSATALVLGDTWTGALARESGEAVGFYNILIGTLAPSKPGNYTVTLSPETFQIIGILVTVTANSGQSKVYGDADPTFSYTVTGELAPGDSWTGSLSREPGTNVGTYAITQGSLAITPGGANYTITFVPANFSITPRPITVTANSQSKVYGTGDPALTYALTLGTIIGGDALTGTATRTAGETVGPYAINQGGVIVSPTPGNYTITWVSANLTITSRPITITAATKTKIYGDGDPALTYTVTSGSLAAGDSWIGSLTRVAGETVAGSPYQIQQGSVAITPGGANYTVTYVPANLTITSRPITITADAKSKEYGSADPALTYQVTSGTLAAGDSWTGALTRNAGEDFGTYTIQQGTVAITPGGANYTITYVSALLTITKRAITVTANTQSKVYGAGDPALTYSLTSGSLIGGDALTGTATRVAGETVGPYAINQGGVTVSPNPGNYTITWVSANLTITSRPITITADAKTKVYGNTDPALTYQVTSGSLASGDSFDGELSRVAGNNVGDYLIQQGSVVITPGGANYTLNYVPANLTITQRPITVTVTAGQNKLYGADDPTSFAYTVTAGSLATGDSFTGAITRAGGEAVGVYAISQGTLSISPAIGNYNFTFAGSNFTINKRNLTITASNITKPQGVLYTFSGTEFTHGTLYFSDAVTSATLSSLGAPAGAATGNYPIVISTALPVSLTNNYNITYVEGTMTVEPRINLSLSGLVANSKTYDGNPTATVSNWGTLTGIVAGKEDVYLITDGHSANFNNKNVGSGKTVTVSGLTLGGSDAIYYSISNQTTTANITQRTLTLSSFTANNKTYDGNTTVTGTGFGDDRVSGDVLTIGFTAAFENANAGVGKTVNYTGINLSGTDAANYVLASTTGIATATIYPKDITITANSGQTKVYGNANPTYTFTTTGLIGSPEPTDLLSRVAGETVGSYAIQIGTLSYGANYNPTFVSADFTITQRPITVNVTAGQTKVYDNGANNPTYTYTVGGSGLATGDTWSGALARLAGEDIGPYAINKGTLTIVEGVTNKEANYNVTFNAQNFTITARPITITAAAKSKVYGEADPELTYTLSAGSLATGDSWTGSLSRNSGEDFGTYTIIQSTLKPSNDGNYAITYESALLTISKRAITIAAQAKTKVYGDDDPVLTYTLVGSLAVGDSWTGNLTRVAGENVGTRQIQQGSLAPTNAGNYSITYSAANLTITVRAITLTADNKSKVYGENDPTLTFQVTSGPLQYSDAIAGTPVRAIGENTGPYAITQGTATVTNASNYAITWANGTFTITSRAITVTADAKTKIYGETDPPLTYEVTSGSLAAGDSFTGAISRATGANVGTYAIGQGTLAITPGGANYTLNFVGANFTITKKDLSVTADAKTKVYGAVDPALTYVAVGLVGTDAVSGALTRDPGNTVGTHAITQGTITAGGNYNLIYTGANLTITARALNITANSFTKTVGFNYVFDGTEFIHGTLYYSDAVTSANITSDGAAGAAVIGNYDINISAAVGSGLSNYNITYVKGNLEVVDKITLTLPDMVAANKVYNQTITATITSWGELDGVLPGDEVSLITSAHTATFNNKNVGNGKTVTVAGLVLDGAQAYKYTIGNQITTANITARTLTLSSFTASNKVYDRTTSVTGTGFSNDRIAGDVLTFSFTAAFVDFNVGNGKTVNYTGIAISGGTDAGNYVLASTTGSTTANVIAKPITVVAHDKSKVYGDPVVPLTYTVTGLISPDAMSGVLARVAGENVGPYAINQNTLTAGSNYTITYTGATLTITAKPITVTADAQTKVYGSGDPTLTYVVVGMVGSDGTSGALTRLAGENVGTYAIGQGTVTAGSNYTITYTGANLTITEKGISVVAVAKTKTYGDADPELTYVVTGLEGGDAMSGALSRLAGSDVGTYAIQQGTLTAGSNYTISYTGANLTITPKGITVTAEAKSKVYGDAEPTLTHTVTGVLGGDTPTGNLIRVAGENAGTYAINQGTLTYGSNYTITYNGANLTILQRPITVTAGAKTKVYGQVDPTLTYTITSGNLVNEDQITGALLRVAGENVGSYAIQRNTLTAGSNYDFTYVGANLAITAKGITVTAHSKSKQYGEADPELTYTVVGLESGDSMSGDLARDEGESLAGSPYAILLGDLTGGANYTITYTGSTLTIIPAPLTITANDIFKTVGTTYTFVGNEFTPTGILYFSDNVTGASLTSAGADVGAAVGTYPIIPSNAVGAGVANYNINYVNGTMTVEDKITLTLTGLTANNKVYDGNTSATISNWGTLSGVEGGDDVSLVTNLAVAAFGSKAVENNKVVNVTGLSLSGADAIKYTIGPQSTTANITKRTLNLSNFTASNKVYDRTTTVSGTGFTNDRLGSDVLTFTFTAAFADFNVGNGKTVSYTGIAISGGADMNNYVLASTTGSTTANITPKAITVIANAQSKVYGNGDPSFTYTISGLIAPDAESGSLTRNAGENVGNYPILQGSLTAGANYTISYTGANLTITQRAITITANAGQNKVYGGTDPVLTYSASGVFGGDTPTGLLARAEGENVGTYAINIGTLSYGANYSTPVFNSANFTITHRPITVTADAKSKVYGAADPGLTHQITDGSLAFSDAISGVLSRVAGENVGSYAIQQHTLTAGANYNLTYVGANLTITAKPITVTADAKSKTYGDGVVALTYQVTSGLLESGDSFSGNLTRVSGENVGTYNINQGTLTAGANYTISYVGALFTINPKALTITVNAGQSKVYGSDDPVFTYSPEGVVGSDTPTGALSREEGEDIGLYAITIGNLSYGANYVPTFESADFEILAKTITISANANQTKVYGQADPVFTYTATGVEPGDVPTGALSRAAGQNVGTYAITQGNLSYGDNYTINFVSNNFTITKKAVTVTPNPGQSRVYDGQGRVNDPIITYSASGLEYGETEVDAFTGKLSRLPGTAVGSYRIVVENINPADNLTAANYSITVAEVYFAITARPISITANGGQTKIYGSADPVFTYTTDNLIPGDNPTGALSRVNAGLPAGRPVGLYAITKGTLTYGSNYSETFISADFSITPKALTITANNRTKSEGQTLTFIGNEFTTSGLVFTDAVTSATITSDGAPSDALPGVYDINISDAVGTGLANYTISYVKGTLNVANLIELTLTGLTANNKPYDGSTLATINSWGALDGIQGGDIVTLNNSGASAFFADENVNNGIQVTVMNLQLAGADAPKYFINDQFTSANITQSDLELSGFYAENKVYDGTTNVTGTHEFNDDRVEGDELEFDYTVAFVDRNVGVGKTVNFTDITISGGADAGNYYLITTTGTATANITTRTLNIEAVAATKVYGDDDPAFAYNILSGLQTGDNASIVTGSLTRDDLTNNNVGAYAIRKGTLDAGVNYSISFISRNLTITPKEITVTADANQSKVYGQSDPVLTYIVDGLEYGELTEDVMSGTLGRESGNNVGEYDITVGDLSAGDNYTIDFVYDVFEITAKPVTITADAKTKVYGAADPGLTYTYPMGSFIGADADNITGGLTREPGQNVNIYQILEGNLNIGSNYAMTYVPANFEITQEALTITANDIEKAEGVEYVFARTEFTTVGLVTTYGDGVASATLASDGAAAEAELGEFDITIEAAIGAGATILANYDIYYVSGKMTVVAKIPLSLSGTIAANKIYDGELTATISDFGSVIGIVSGDDVSLNYEDIVAEFEDKNVGAGKTVTISGIVLEGEDAPKYIIGEQTATANIIVRPLALSNFIADAKYYDGTTDVTGTDFDDDRIAGDELEFTFDAAFRFAIVNQNEGHPRSVDFTNITISGGVNASNYNLITTSGSVLSSIMPKPVEVTAEPKSIIYGGADVVLTYSTDLPLVGDEEFTLEREVGTDAASYAILLVDNAVTANYDITYNAANYVIQPMPITITADDKGRVYGGASVILTYTSDPTEADLPFGDHFSGNVVRVAGTNVGTYTIEQGNLTILPKVENYEINFVEGEFVITPKPITVYADNKSKTYGDGAIILTFTTDPDPALEAGDVWTGSLIRDAGENVDIYEINIGSLSVDDGNEGNNYNVSLYAGEDRGMYEIIPRDLFVSADNQYKSVGQDDPEFTYSVSGFVLGDTEAIISGALSREPGEALGDYTITQGNLSAGNNYNIIFTPGTLTISGSILFIAADAKAKTYGDGDPVYTWSHTGGVLDGQHEIVGELSRDAGENVGQYQIRLGTLKVVDKVSGDEIEDVYTLLLSPAQYLTITPLAIEVIVDAKTKIYGQDDPELTFSLSTSLVNGDEFTLTRELGNNAGVYPITLVESPVNANYDITFTGANFIITPKPITITADNKSRVYGGVSVTLTYTVSSNLEYADIFNGALVRDAGADVGAYAIRRGTLEILPLESNYDIEFVEGELTITERPLTVIAESKSKVYGEVDPEFTFILSSGSLVGDDGFVGSLSREPGENVGNHTITQGTLAVTNNYNITFESAQLTITAKPITISADAKTKTYGDEDPAFTFQITNGELIEGDEFSGELFRSVGEDVGVYAINQGTLTAGDNYNIAFIGENLTVVHREISIIVHSNLFKEYGDEDPILTYNVEGMVEGDELTGSLSRTAGESIGEYEITIGSLTASSNYSISFTGSVFSIVTRSITVTADALNKLYGTIDPGLTYTITSGSLIGFDQLTGSLVRQEGEDVGEYLIEQGDLTAGSNYSLTYASAYLTINSRPLEITAQPKTKVYGNVDPELTYTITGGSIVEGQYISGLLSRLAGEGVGAYGIQVGTLTILQDEEIEGEMVSNDISANYSIAFVGADLTIMARPLTITADAKSKVYGNSDPSLTYQLTSGTMQFEDVITGSLSRVAGENVGAYAIQVGTVTAGANYNLLYVGSNLTITGKPITVTANALTKVYGEVDPLFTYEITVGELVDGDVFSGVLDREVGENVGTYAIDQGTLSAGNNYIIAFEPAEFTITVRPLTVIPVAGQFKIKGQVDPTLEYTYNFADMVTGDSFAGSLARVEGEDVGLYDIEIGSLTAGTNYEIALMPEEFTIYAQLSIIIDPVGAGTVSGAGNYLTNDVVNLVAAANAGFIFEKWTIGEEEIGTNATLSYTMPSDNVTITANFIEDVTIYVLTLEASPADGGSVSGGGEYLAGNEVVVSAIENENFIFVNWTMNGVEVSSYATFTFTMPSSNVTLVANFRDENSNEVILLVNPVGAGTVSGAGYYLEGEEVFITATPNIGYHFVNWADVDGEVSTQANYSFIMPAEPVTLTANFELNTYTIVVTAQPEEGGVVTGGGNYTHGSEVVVSATANEGYQFAEWQLNGVEVSANATYTFIASANIELVAVFVQEGSYEVSLTVNPSGAGTVSGAGWYIAGAEVTVIASANTGYEFVNWTNSEGIEVSIASVYAFTMPESNVNLVANFALIDYNVVLNVNPVGTGTVSGSGIYSMGDMVSITATANQGYQFVNWTNELDEVISSNANYSFTMPADDVTLTANFEEDIETYSLTLVADPNYAGNVLGAGQYQVGQQVNISAVPNAGYVFTYWSIDEVFLSNEASIVYTMPANNVVITAHFVPEDQYEVIVTVNPEFGGSVTGFGWYLADDVVTLIAIPADGFIFVSWTDVNEEVVSTDPSYSFTMPANNVMLTANFEEIHYVLTLQVNPVEAGVVTGEGEYIEGASVQITATANSGYVFVSWIDENEVIISTAPNFTFIMPAEDVTLIAYFTEQPVYTVTFTVVNQEEVAIEGAIILVENVYELVTDEFGVASMELIDGSYSFTATAEGYEDYSGAFVVNGESLDVNVTMIIVGIDDNPLANLEVFPNPFSNRINLRNTEGLSRVVITNLAGQTVMVINNPGTVIETENLTAGIYLIRFVDNKGNFTLRKLVRE